MQLLIEEMGLADTVDPMGGSHYIETLTNQMESEMVRVMADVDARGGIVKGISEGHVQAQVSQQAYEHQKALKSGEFRKVGVNCYVEEDEETQEVDLHGYDEAAANAQIAGLRKVRAERDNAAVEAALGRLRAASEGGDNVMPALMEAVKAYASVGEMTKVMVEVFGRYQEPIRF